jgi:hypothetical protein
VWVWEVNKCEGGNVDAIVAKAKAAHLGHVLIRVTSNGDRWAKFNERDKVYALARGLKAEGIRVYAWGYNYPFAKNKRRQAAQIRLVKSLIADSAFDGYVYNVETEFAGCANEAKILMAPVKKFRDSEYPDKLLGYSTFCRINRGRGAQMPILEFNRWNDVAMPQAYWRDFNWSPRKAAVQMCSTWLEKERAWQRQGIADVARPIFPTAHAYNGEGATEYISPEELAAFLDATDGYYAVNIWSWQHMAPEHWEVLKVGAASWLAREVSPKPESVQRSGHQRWSKFLGFALLGWFALTLIRVWIRVPAQFGWATRTALIAITVILTMLADVWGLVRWTYKSARRS